MIPKSLILDYPACTEPHVKKLIINNATKILYKKGEYITVPGDNIDCVKYIYSGSVRVLMIHPDGYEKILYIISEGWFLREAHFVGDITHKIAKNFSIAEEDVTIYSINKKVFKKLSSDISFLQALLRSCAMKRSILVDELYSFTFNTSEERVKKLIIASINYDDKPIDENWHPLRFQYTHQDMGLILGLNRVTVCKIINNLCRDRFIRIVNKKIQVNRDKINFS